MKKIVLKARLTGLLIAFLLASLLPLAAQSVSIYIEDVQAEVAGVALVDVRVGNFQDIAGLQFSINWDASQLSFIGVENMALGASLGGNFNINSTSEGKLGYIIADMSLAGFNMSDGDVLFTLRFNVTMPDNSATTVVFSGDPVDQVVADVTSAALETSFISGQVIVGLPASLIELSTNDPRFKAVPNPFQQSTQITYQAARAGQGVLSVFAVNGQAVFTRTLDLQSGDNTLLLQSSNFPSRGIYLLRLSTKDGIFSRKVVFTAP